MPRSNAKFVCGVLDGLLFAIQYIARPREDLIDLIKSALITQPALIKGVGGDSGKLSSIAGERPLADLQQVRL
ncbi:hypothetical protein SNARM312S_00666 [Streptomyces narbonensis]